MTRCSSRIAIIPISILGLVLALSAGAQNLVSVTPAQEPLVVHSGVVEDVSASLGERSFWDGIPLPVSAIPVVIFQTSGPTAPSATFDYDALVIVPELNAAYKYRFCGERVFRVWKEDLWITWTPWAWSPGGKKVGSDDYLAQQISRFSDFVSHAKRIDRILEISTDPAKLFHVDPQFKAQRLAQIQRAATELFHKPLRIEVADFSDSTEEIDTLIPAIGQMVTFHVSRACSKADEVEVGKEYPLQATRSELRKKIEANSTVLLAK
jgi:hypothetical protein